MHIVTVIIKGGSAPLEFVFRGEDGAAKFRAALREPFPVVAVDLKDDFGRMFDVSKTEIAAVVSADLRQIIRGGQEVQKIQKQAAAAQPIAPVVAMSGVHFNG